MPSNWDSASNSTSGSLRKEAHSNKLSERTTLIRIFGDDSHLLRQDAPLETKYSPLKMRRLSHETQVETGNLLMTLKCMH